MSAAHGSGTLALLLAVSSQLWIAADLAGLWFLRWRHANMQRDVVRAALQEPANTDLRTLLVDLASTHLDDLGDRLPARLPLDRDPNGVPPGP